MKNRLNFIWLGLIVIAGLLSILYLGNAIFPGRINPDVLQFFSMEQAQKARAFNIVPRLIYILSFIIQTSLLIWVVFSKKGIKFTHWFIGKIGESYWRNIIVYSMFLWIILRISTFPLTFYGGYFWQHAWGFSTQSIMSWFLDYLKSSLIDIFLSICSVIIFFYILNRWQRIWWIIGAGLLALWLVLENLLWPVIVAPIFNNFKPVHDPAVVAMVKQLVNKANISIDEVLVMDASKRTTMVNAYFTGLGKTKQIVIYDNLLENYPLNEIKAVLAHEMGHWLKGHIAKGIVLGIMGDFLVWGMLIIFLRPWLSLTGRVRPETWAVMQLFVLLILFISNPLQNYISRTMEIQADQISLELTRNTSAEVQLQVDLASKNMSDLSPPDFIVWFSYTHPPVMERIKIAEGK